MDHKVSKDMISSGMIPSGEKTQADLGRTQYGSAPSPSSLMDAYKSIYEHHQKDKDGNTIPHEEEQVDEAIAGLAARGLMGAARGARVAGKLAAQGAVRARQIQASGGFRKVAGAAAQKAAQSKVGQSVVKAGQGIKKTVGAPGFKGALAGGAIGGAVGASMMSGGKKKESGGGSGIVRPGPKFNTYSQYDMNFDYTPEGDLISEDLFDELKSALIEEGCDEKNVMKIMASVTPDYFNEIIQEENIDEVVVTGSVLAGLAAKKLLAGAIAKKVGAVALKKGLGAAVKTGTKLGSKYIAQKGGKMAAMKAVSGEAGKGLMKGAGKALSSPVGSQAAMIGGMSAMNRPPSMPTMPAQQRAASAGRRTAGGLRMDLDLFDVVKGKLLDEGLTEEECTEVMTTLTLDEIQENLGKITLGQIAGGAAKLGAVAAGGALAHKAIKKGKEASNDAINKQRNTSPIGGNTRPGADKIEFGK